MTTSEVQPVKSKSYKFIKRLNLNIGVIEVESDHGTLGVEKDLSESLSPVTPSSKFTTSVIKTSTDGIINCILLSHWDNILGPRIVHLWTVPNKPHYSHNVCNKVCSQSLSGEICRECDNCFIDYKLFSNADDGIIIPVFVFTANTISGPAVHSLSLIIEKTDLTLFLQLQHLIIRCMERLVGKLRILFHKVSDILLAHVLVLFSVRCLMSLQHNHHCTYFYQILIMTTFNKFYVVIYLLLEKNINIFLPPLCFKR
jgi:hypothetical protein